MYTKRLFPVKDVLFSHCKYLLFFLFLSAIPVVFYDILDLKWLQLPWLPIGVLGTAVAFVIGFKNNASYDRLWEARKIWGGIVNTSRSWTIMVKDFITTDNGNNTATEDELKSLKKELVNRHIAWITALRYQLRKEKPWEMQSKKRSFLNELKPINLKILELEVPLKEEIKPYLTEADFINIFNKGNQASQLLGIQSKRLKELKHERLIDNFRHIEMTKILVELYTLQGKCERIKNFPYPRQYATLNYIFVWIFILLIPFGIMAEFESYGEKTLELININTMSSMRYTIQSTIAKHFVWFSVPFSSLVAWVFHSMEVIGESTENPFEGDFNDVPITDMSRGIEIDIKQLIDDNDIPEPYKWENDVVM